MARKTLEIDIRNPYGSLEKTMTVSSDPLTHHRVAGGDFAIDINMPGIQNAGEIAVFDIVPTCEAREARGVVLRGEGKTFLACNKWRFRSRRVRCPDSVGGTRQGGRPLENGGHVLPPPPGGTAFWAEAGS